VSARRGAWVTVGLLAIALAAVIVLLRIAVTSANDRRTVQATARADPADEWVLHGKDTREQRYSPLDQIDTSNVERLGLAWQFDLGTERGLEATPLVRDGVLYLTGGWSRVYAIDARRGALLWSYDPKVPGATARNGCCDVVNRGVALWKDRVISATYDGRLISLDAGTGREVWSVDTIADRSLPYTITGAPRLAGDKVLIGNAGAEFGVRGYVSAYDIETGRLAWRFFTVPANRDGPFEHPELKAAAETWDATTEDWHDRAGGTIWDSMTYDPELNYVFVGTGNAPWTGAVPNPGQGDKLYTASILALDASTGRMVWYYQQTPGDRWDFTSTQHIILADLTLGGERRKVLLQAPKNGFFYVLDARTGALISARPYAHTSWASGIDMQTGRPVLTETAKYWNPDRETLVYPWVAGAHNWHPMSYSPKTGLVYIPAQQAWWIHTTRRVTHFEEQTPDFRRLLGDQPLLPTKGSLLAWDPVKGAPAWEHAYPTMSNGGTLATAGNLVFQGSADGVFRAFDATTGQMLKAIDVGTGIVAPPITYRLDGTQYIAVLAGYGGALFFMMDEDVPARTRRNEGRLLVMKLDGTAAPLPPLKSPATVSQYRIETTPEEVDRGIDLYRTHCGRCHGMLSSTALLPDLRTLSDEKHGIFEQIVLGGALAPLGMASFADVLKPQDVRAIQAAVIYLRDHPNAYRDVVDPGAYAIRPGR
jgi:quinohemoprotein ethanol dehydrogenase